MKNEACKIKNESCKDKMHGSFFVRSQTVQDACGVKPV